MTATVMAATATVTATQQHSLKSKTTANPTKTSITGGKIMTESYFVSLAFYIITKFAIMHFF